MGRGSSTRWLKRLGQEDWHGSIKRPKRVARKGRRVARQSGGRSPLTDRLARGTSQAILFLSLSGKPRWPNQADFGRRTALSRGDGELRRKAEWGRGRGSGREGGAELGFGVHPSRDRGRVTPEAERKGGVGRRGLALAKTGFNI